jgi:leader peptidase (prepilin peptidase)/N-methyltransferase
MAVIVPTLAELPHGFLIAVAVPLGLIFGSFLNVVIHRWPLGQSVVRPGSHCPACGVPIRGYDNVPVVSWLLLRGRARCCGARISVRYPAIELLCGLLAWAIVERIVLGLPPDTAWWSALAVFAAYSALGLGLIAAAFIDLEHMYLPDEVTLGGTALGLLSVPVRPGATWLDALIGAAIGFTIIWLPFDLLYRAIRGQPGMGLGDAKLMMLAGAWFGWHGAVFALLAGAIQGTVVALAVFAAQGRIDEPEAVTREREEMRREIAASTGAERERLEADFALDPVASEPEAGLGKARLAFGPFLVLAILEFMLFGHDIVGAYAAWLWNV